MCFHFVNIYFVLHNENDKKFVWTHNENNDYSYILVIFNFEFVTY